MLISNKLRSWLNGSFTTMRCGREFNTMTFSYGETICPDCYNGEKQFLFHDQDYWLNWLTTKLVNHKEPEPEEEEPYDPHLTVQNYMPQIEA
jgi:hypothetical protein